MVALARRKSSERGLYRSRDKRIITIYGSPAVHKCETTSKLSDSGKKISIHARMADGGYSSQYFPGHVGRTYVMVALQRIRHRSACKVHSAACDRPDETITVSFCHVVVSTEVVLSSHCLKPTSSRQIVSLSSQSAVRAPYAPYVEQRLAAIEHYNKVPAMRIP